MLVNFRWSSIRLLATAAVQAIGLDGQIADSQIRIPVALGHFAIHTSTNFRNYEVRRHLAGSGH